MKKKEKLSTVRQYYPNALTTLDRVKRISDIIVRAHEMPGQFKNERGTPTPALTLFIVKTSKPPSPFGEGLGVRFYCASEIFTCTPALVFTSGAELEM
ncbi:MAG: hypothetical protein SFU87_07035 [Chitinophagaceae bacterium]|nr:hypothetical protein [Chitinophagaceae bacterium]